MGRGRRGGDRREREVPIPLDPVDLLAGIAPGVELHADELPPDADTPLEDDAAVVSVAEVGKMLRSGDDTIRRLIRTPGLSAPPPDAETADEDERPEIERAGVVPRSRTRPGE